MARVLLRARHLAARIGFRFGRLWPVRPRVVLATSHAGTIGGNLAVIRAELAGRRPAVDVVVLARPVPRTRLERVVALVDVVVAGYHLATGAVFIVDDYYFPLYAVRPRSGTTVAQVWHACGAFKKFGYSVLDKSFGKDEDFVRRVPIHTNYDICLVSSMRFAPSYAEAFRQPLDRFTSRFGIPRTDVFFGEERTASLAAAVRRRYQIREDRRVILYAPTFRGETIGLARAPMDLDLPLLRSVLGDDHVVLVRLHPFVRSRWTLGAELADFAVDVSDYPDINELMLSSDLLVTDYSSAIYEFSLLGRPMAFFAPDHAAYEAERGFYLDFPTDLPGPVFETTAALAAYLRAGVFDLERIRRFRDDSFDVADGHSAQRFVDEVVLPTLGPRAPGA